MDLIVNADDLGLSRQVNDSIFEFIDLGLVTSATIIANSFYVEEACQRLGQYPSCSFGVHLNASEFPPLSGPNGLGPILDDSGSFSLELLQKAKIKSELAGGIFREFCAQIEELQGLGVELSHIDSHHYVHTFASMFPILKKVQRKFQIRKVRLTRNIYGVDEKVPWFLKMKKSAYNFLLRHYYPTKTTQGFGGFDMFHENAVASPMKHRSFEAVVHPGNPFYDQQETDLLRGPWRDEIDFPVRLISYAELG